MTQQKPKSPYRDYVKYSNLAFQILAVFLIAVFGGLKADACIAMKFPLFTLSFSLIAILVVFIIIIKVFKN